MNVISWQRDIMTGIYAVTVAYGELAATGYANDYRTAKRAAKLILCRKMRQ